MYNNATLLAITSYSTILAAFATLWTALIMWHSFRKSQLPNLTFKRNNVQYAYYNQNQNMTIFWGNRSDFYLVNNNKRSPLQFELFNIGNGPAKDVEIEIYNIKSPYKYIKTAPGNYDIKRSLMVQSYNFMAEMESTSLSFILNSNDPVTIELPEPAKFLIDLWVSERIMVDKKVVPFSFSLLMKYKDSTNSSIQERFYVELKNDSFYEIPSWGFMTYVTVSITPMKSKFKKVLSKIGM